MRSSNEIIHLIKHLRETKKMSIEELARRVGIAKSTQSRYENGQRDFPINDIGLYAGALDTTIEYLLGVGTGTNDDIETIAAHHDGEEWTEEELEEIEEFKEFIRMKRRKSDK